MPLERIFDERDISELLEQNSAPPYGARNAALIAGCSCWGLTPKEASNLTTETVIAPNGQFYKTWVLPAHESYNNEPREIYTKDHILFLFEKYATFRLESNWGTAKIHSHRGLDPKSHFFLNDNGQEYKLTKMATGHYQAKSMNEQLKRMIDRTGLHGATPSSFRDSYIKLMYEAGLNWNELKKVSGIKQKKTLERKVRPHERELEEVLSKLFTRVRMPEVLK